MSDSSEVEDVDRLQNIPINAAEGPFGDVNLPPLVAARLAQQRGAFAGAVYDATSLQLTTEAINHNPGDYSAWEHRRRCLEQMGRTERELKEELVWTRTLVVENPKTYQVWRHRQWLVDRIGKPCGDLVPLAGVMTKDPKNMHAWSYRQWFVHRFAMPRDGEWAMMEQLIAADPYNHSAWHYRDFLLKEYEWPLAAAVRDREMRFALERADETPDNESPWMYLKAFLGSERSFEENPEGQERPWSSLPQWIEDRIDAILERDSNARHALECKAYHLLALGRRVNAIEHLITLRDTADTIRSSYWQWLIDCAPSAEE